MHDLAPKHADNSELSVQETTCLQLTNSPHQSIINLLIPDVRKIRSEGR